MSIWLLKRHDFFIHSFHSIRPMLLIILNIIALLFSCVNFFYFNFIYFTSWLQFLSSSPKPSPYNHPSVFQKRAGLLISTVRLGISSFIKVRQGSPVGEKGPKGRQQSQKQFLLPLLGVPQEDQAIVCFFIMLDTEHTHKMLKGQIQIRMAKSLWF